MNPETLSIKRLTNCFPIAALGMALLLSATPAKALTINAKFESSWSNNAPAGATADVQTVINEFTSLFKNPVTLNFQFGWGDYVGTNSVTSGAVAYFPQLFQASPAQYTLAQTKTLFTNHAVAHPENLSINTAIQYLPGTFPNPGGSTNFFISDAEYKALTGSAQNTDAIDGYVGIGNTDNWKFGAGAGATNTEYFIGALEHEISHAMGRFDIAYAATNGGNPSFLTPLNFFKYNNTPALDPTRSVTSFSIDGGTTLGLKFNASSDSSDWNNSSSDSFNAFVSNFQSMSATDITEMQALGWDPVPEPSAFSLLACAGGALLFKLRRDRKKQS